MADGKNITLNKWKFALLQNPNDVAKFFQENDISKLTKNELVYLLTRITIVSVDGKLDAYNDLIRDEISNRRVLFTNYVSILISMISLFFAVIKSN